MNGWLIAGIVVVVVVAGAVLAAYLKPNPEAGNRAKLDVVLTADEQRLVDSVVVSPTELAAGDGRDGHRCLLAVNGVVYDLSALPSWARNGKHHGVSCGTDGTEKFVRSSHARAVLEKMVVVGRLGG